MALNMKVDPQYDEFLKSSEDKKRIVDLLLEIQLICLNDDNFSSHQNIGEMKNISDSLSNKIESKKIILDRAIAALKEIAARQQQLHDMNMKAAESYLQALG
jgi:hypothetical protein